MMTEKIKIYQVLYIVTIMIYGCSPISSVPINTPTAEQIDKSPFTGIPCVAPCWYGLEVGKSSEVDVRNTLPVLTFIEKETLFFHEMSLWTLDESQYALGVEITASCINMETCLTISIANDILTEILILLNYEITAYQSIEHLGNPNYVAVEEIGTPTGRLCGIYLIWKNKLVLASQIHNKSGIEIYECDIIYETGQIPAETKISEIRYLSDAAVERLLATGTGEIFEFTGLILSQ